MRNVSIPHICPAVLQTSLLFSKDYGLLSFLRKSLSSDEVGMTERLVNSHAVNRKKALTLTQTSVLQFREARIKILYFLETFLDRISPRLKGWERTYATDIRVSSPVLHGWNTCFLHVCLCVTTTLGQGEYRPDDNDSRGNVFLCKDASACSKRCRSGSDRSRD